MIYIEQLMYVMAMMIPVIIYLNMISARKMRLNGQSGPPRRVFHIFLFILVLGTISLILRHETVRGAGPWVVIAKAPDAWMLPTIIQGYLDFAHLAFNSLTMGLYHVATAALLKLPNLSQEIPSDETRATELTTRIVISISLMPLAAATLIALRKAVLLFRIRMAYNPLLVRQLKISYYTGYWYRGEKLMMSAAGATFRTAITITAAMFAGLIAAPLVRDSFISVAIMMGSYALLHFWANRRGSGANSYR